MTGWLTVIFAFLILGLMLAGGAILVGAVVWVIWLGVSALYCGWQTYDDEQKFQRDERRKLVAGYVTCALCHQQFPLGVTADEVVRVDPDLPALGMMHVECPKPQPVRRRVLWGVR